MSWWALLVEGTVCFLAGDLLAVRRLRKRIRDAYAQGSADTAEQIARW